MMKAEEKGKFLLGGCVPGEMNWYCLECENYFTAQTKMPCGYCFTCQAFLAPKHVKIVQNSQKENIKICLNCNGVVSP
jgi:hypothetical protein